MEAVEGSEWRKEQSGARCFNQKVRYLDVAYYRGFTCLLFLGLAGVRRRVEGDDDVRMLSLHVSHDAVMTLGQCQS